MTKREVEEYIMSQIFPNASHEVTAQNVRNAFAPIVERVWTFLEGEIGDLSQLQTTDKQSVVNAINYVLSKLNHDITLTKQEIATLGQKVGELVRPKDSEETKYVTGIADENGNLAIAVDNDGDLHSKNFNSKIAPKVSETEDYALAIGDKQGNVALAVDNEGNILSKKFDSKKASQGGGNAKIVDDDSNNLFGVGDANGNLILNIDKDGNLKIPNFDSSKGIGNTLQYESALGQDCEIITASSVSANNMITSVNYPFFAKKGHVISLYAELSSFESLIVGKGYNQYRGQWLEIDTTNIVRCKYESSRVVKDTKAHGLTISSFVKLCIYHSDNGKVDIILQSKNGTYQTTLTTDFEWNYSAFAQSSTALTNVKFCLGNTNFKKSVWMFGDSYFGVDSSRWVGCLKNMGYFNYYCNGLAGQKPNGAYDDLVRSLRFGTPKYLVWALGMNGSNAEWETYTSKVKELCKQKNINLVLTTIPTVPTRDKETISQNVRESGYRYIDFYRAVGTNAQGEWYTGMLSSDGVHPTSLGANTLATQVIVDFPELMQYGNSKGESVGENDGGDL